MEYEDYLLFNGKKLYWKTINTKTNRGYLNKYVWNYAVSGLKKNNPYIKRLIEKGRTDIKENTDYTQRRYQYLSKAGPIKNGTYYLKLTKSMKFQKSGGGWGAGGWSIYPTNSAIRRLGFLEVNFDIDLPWIRSGFFLHEDGGKDGTAGCIGISKHGILNLRKYLREYAAKTKADKIHILVDYNAKN